MKDTRYSNSKKRFDGFKNYSYLCKRNREDSSLNVMVVVAQLLSSLNIGRASV